MKYSLCASKFFCHSNFFTNSIFKRRRIYSKLPIYVKNELDNYRLHNDVYNGTAGDQLISDHSLDEMQFLTMDRDNDLR